MNIFLELDFLEKKLCFSTILLFWPILPHPFRSPLSFELFKIEPTFTPITRTTHFMGGDNSMQNVKCKLLR